METLIKPDDGYYFGIGVFETIAVEQGRMVLCSEHLARMAEGISFFGLGRTVEEAELLEFLEKQKESEGWKHGALKVTVSRENCVISLRPNTYTAGQYAQGFAMDFSEIRRNETSPFTYHKTLNYGECILEKRKAHERGLDELIFLNSQGQICEGCTTNIFFGKQGKVFAPPLSCGMLPGVMRQFVYEQAEKAGNPVTEQVLYPEDLEGFDECFVTNSLLGVMSGTRLGKYCFPERICAEKLRACEVLNLHP